MQPYVQVNFEYVFELFSQNPVTYTTKLMHTMHLQSQSSLYPSYCEQNFCLTLFSFVLGQSQTGWITSSGIVIVSEVSSPHSDKPGDLE